MSKNCFYEVRLTLFNNYYDHSPSRFEEKNLEIRPNLVILVLLTVFSDFKFDAKWGLFEFREEFAVLFIALRVFIKHTVR